MTLGILTLALAIGAALVTMVLRFSLFHRFSIVGTAFLVLFATHGISAVPYAAGALRCDPILTHYFCHLPVDPEMAWVLAASFLFFAAGAVLAARLLRFDLASAQTAFFGQTPDGRAPRWWYLPIAIGGVVLGLLFVFGGHAGLLALARQGVDGATISELRRTFPQAHPFYYFGSYSRNLLLPLVTLIALNTAAERASRPWRWAAPALFALLIVVSLANLQKLPVIIALCFVLLNRFFRTTRDGATSPKTLLIPMVLVAGLGTVLFIFSGSFQGKGAVFATFDRLMWIPLQCLEGFLRVYPTHQPFHHGLGIGLISKLAGAHLYVEPASIVGKFLSGSPHMSATAFWAAELWGAFGYPGVILGSLLAGSLLVALDCLVLQCRRTSVSIAVYGYLAIVSVQLSDVSIFTVMLSGGMMFALLFLPLLQPRPPEVGAVNAP